MLRVLSAFLCLFWLLSMVVHLEGLAYAFGLAAAALLAIDLVLSDFASSPRISGTQRRPLH